MKILFLDQSGQLGGAELCLTEIAKSYRDRCLVGLLADGPFRSSLEQHQIPVQVLIDRPLQVRKESGWIQGLSSLGQLLPLIAKVAHLSRDFDLIYANTQKAMVVGALASLISRRPLVYHLHDILSHDHFSSANLHLAVTLANRFAALVLATSEAAKQAFISAGGQPDRVEVVYNGFDPQAYQCDRSQVERIRQNLGLQGKFVVGHFSRLSPWKGQHVLIEALKSCPPDVTAILVGDALYGEQAYGESLQAQVNELGLSQRVQFLGFRSDVVPLMHACDAIVHSSTAPEPFGRVIAEAMLCGRPVIAAQAGGALELVQPGQTGWLVPPADPEKLAAAIQFCHQQSDWVKEVADQAQRFAKQQFNHGTIHQQIAQFLDRLIRRSPNSSLATQDLQRPMPTGISADPLNQQR